MLADILIERAGIEPETVRDMFAVRADAIRKDQGGDLIIQVFTGELEAIGGQISGTTHWLKPRSPGKA
jgi:hypothetical protein